MSPVWTTACLDWEQRIADGRSLVPCGPLYPEQAASDMEVFNAFRVVDVAGAPTVGEIARPWISDFASAFFGSYNPENGKRSIRTFFLKVPKKNWKSGIASFLMGTLLIRNWRESGEFGIIAPTTEVANNAFGPLKHAIRKDEELSDLLHVQDHIRTITNRSTKATLQVVAAESDTVSGKKFIVTLVEELWQFGKRANADGMLMEATGGMASRDEGAVIYITTESDDAPAGVYLSKNLYARKVRDGEVHDPSFMPVLYEWPTSMLREKAFLDVDNAHIVNPNFGASVSSEWMRTNFAEKRSEGDRAFQVFLAKHLNVEIGLTMRSDRWVGADFWEQAAIPLSLEELLQRAEVVTAGVDGGGLDDLLGLTLIGRERGTRKWLVWSKAWAHEIVLTRRKEIAPRLRDFEKDGNLVIVARPGEDIVQVADILCQVRDYGVLPERNAIGVDRHGIGALISELESPGRDFVADQIQGIPQGYQLMGAIKDTERMLAGGDMLHADTPLMNWCVGNARVEQKGNAILITKAISGSAKIDPLMALFDAAALMALNPEGLGASFWETNLAAA